MKFSPKVKAVEVGGQISDRAQRSIQDFTAWNTLVRAYEILAHSNTADPDALAFAIDIAESFRALVDEDSKEGTCTFTSLTQRGVACGFLVRVPRKRNSAN